MEDLLKSIKWPQVNRQYTQEAHKKSPRKKDKNHKTRYTLRPNKHTNPNPTKTKSPLT